MTKQNIEHGRHELHTNGSKTNARNEYGYSALPVACVVTPKFSKPVI